MPATSVHPRARGEHDETGTDPARDDGSSPRSRGTHNEYGPCDTRERFIPALAGNTQRCERIREHVTVHPRARGEHRPRPWTRWRRSGSSPRSRGPRLAEGDRAGSGRFIPALAGNTDRAGGRAGGAAVHPRARGEHVQLLTIVARRVGSSPRSRGTPFPFRDSPPRLRFIPALAGNTRRRSKRRARRTVHPRARGEHDSTISSAPSASGSSPRSRGTLPSLQRAAGRLRFIPALAGNTKGGEMSEDRASVHPRARGEHAISGSDVPTGVGSSPRSRGTPAPIWPERRRFRFIPALAGNTQYAARH